MIRLVAVALTLAACADGGESFTPCATDSTCDDHDPCTDDRCVDEACAWIPTNAVNACRTDAHCDDGIACSVDTCALDGCGLMRCAHAFGPDCTPCTTSTGCADEDPCTADVCQLGVCAHLVSSDCDRRGDMRAPDPQEGIRLEGKVAPEPCECPCTAAARFHGERLFGDPAPSCDLRCFSDGSVRADCKPLAHGPWWVVIAQAHDGWEPIWWAMSGKTIVDDAEWQGTITWSVPEHLGSTSFVGTSSVDELRLGDIAEDFRGPRLFATMQRTSASDAFPMTFTVLVNEVGIVRRSTVTLYPSEHGLVGPVHSTDDTLTPIVGRIELDWQRML